VERVVIVGIVVAVAVLVAWVVDRRARRDAPTQPRGSVPTQLDRSDFAEPGSPWLVAVFTSATCRSCQAALDDAHRLADTEVAVIEVEASARPDLHRRYAIDSVPTVTIADPDGVVQRAFLGSPGMDELQRALAAARDPDGSPSDAGLLRDRPSR
jgi:hypothetical protein